MKIHGSPYQRAGFPDIVGCIEGMFVGLEIKLPGKELTPLQEHEIDAIRTKGRGCAARASSVEEAIRVVRSALSRAKRSV
jgi:hypothetical protein